MQSLPERRLDLFGRTLELKTELDRLLQFFGHPLQTMFIPRNRPHSRDERSRALPGAYQAFVLQVLIHSSHRYRAAFQRDRQLSNRRQQRAFLQLSAKDEPAKLDLDLMI